MKVDLKKLYLLKEQIQTTKDFEIPVHYFFDNFADFPEFINLCEHTEDALLDKIIISIGQEIFKKQKVEVQQKLFLSLKEHHFIHGPVIIENHMMSFAYFTDIKLGVFSVHMESKVMYGRMNALNLSKLQMLSGINLN